MLCNPRQAIVRGACFVWQGFLQACCNSGGCLEFLRLDRSPDQAFNRRDKFSIALLLFVLSIGSAEGRTWYVKPDSTGDAPTILAAMDSASAGDEVLLAAGVYTPTTQGITEFLCMIDITPGVNLRGESGSNLTIIDGEGFVRIIRCLDVGDVAINGLTIMRGATSQDDGGGIWSIGNSRLTISNCIIRDCRSGQSGAGVFCDNSTISNCEILDNFAGLLVGFGGGMVASNSVISGCIIRGNRVLGDSNAAGGGVSAIGSSLRDCWIEGNSASAGFFSAGGGVSGGTIIERCTFLNNTAFTAAPGRSEGGALSTGAEIIDCIFLGNEAIAGGGRQARGGAVRGGAGFSMTRCTVVGNTATTTGPERVAGISVISTGTINSTIIAWNDGLPCNGTPVVSCSVFFGNSLGDSICGVDGGGNFVADPEFCVVDPTSTTNLILQSDSPCVTGNHPDGASCALIGAFSVGCGSVAVEKTTWGEVKTIFRRE